MGDEQIPRPLKQLCRQGPVNFCPLRNRHPLLRDSRQQAMRQPGDLVIPTATAGAHAAANVRSVTCSPAELLVG